MKEQDFGIFLSFQNPEEIAGIKTSDFLRFAKTKVSDEKITAMNFALRVSKEIENLNMKKDMQGRYLNVGFSGGEKKKNEILQLSILKPKLAMLDEVDSGLDVDAVHTVSENIKAYHTEENALILITHLNQLLKFIPPDVVHVLIDGRIVKEGGSDLVDVIEMNGFDAFRTEV